MVLLVTNHHRTCSTVLVSGACSWMVDMVSLYSEQNPHDTDTERTGLMRRSMFRHWFYADPRENNLSGNRKHGDILRLNVNRRPNSRFSAVLKCTFTGQAALFSDAMRAACEWARLMLTAYRAIGAGASLTAVNRVVKMLSVSVDSLFVNTIQRRC